MLLFIGAVIALLFLRNPVYSRPLGAKPKDSPKGGRAKRRKTK